MGHILTFDLGTTYFKTCLFDENEQLVASHRVASPFTSDTIGRSELAVADFEACLCNGVHALSKQHSLQQVKWVTFASQANTFTMLGAEDEPLVPFISWTDARAGDQLPWLQSFADSPSYYATTGVPFLNVDFMVAKVRWLQQYEPHLVERTRKLCCLSTYLTLWLTGNFLSEASLAGMTGLANIHELEYCSALLERAEIAQNCLPCLVRAGTDAGVLRPEVAVRMGLPGDARLIVGCLDQFAGAVGAGNTTPGGVSETTGTVLATLRCSDSFSDALTTDVFQGPGYREGIYYQMVFSSLSAGLLELYRNALPDAPSFAELEKWAEQIPSGAEGLRINPQAAARRDLANLFDGRTARHGRGHEVRAILEGVADELHRQVKLLCAGSFPKEIRAGGGGARSRLWLEIKSEVLGVPVRRVECPEPTSLGAAGIVRNSVYTATETQ